MQQQQETQNQEAVPQFSTNPDQSPIPTTQNHHINPHTFHNQGQNQNNYKNGSNTKGLITQFGRQLSGNHDLDLNFKKKQTLAPKGYQSSFKMGRNSDGGTSEKTPQIGNQKEYLLKNPTFKMAQNHQIIGQNSGLPKFGHQRTINLDFVNELKIGLDTSHNGNILNYDTGSVSANNNINENQDRIVFNDPNISVIQQNPRGSEFMDQHEDYEDSQQEDVDNLDIQSQQEEDLSARGKVGPYKPVSQAESPVFKQSRQSSPKRSKRSNNIEEQIQQEHMITEQKEKSNSALDIAGIMQRSHGSKMSQGEYNTQNQDSEADQFIPKIDLMNQQQSRQQPLHQHNKLSFEHSSTVKDPDLHHQVHLQHQLLLPTKNPARTIPLSGGKPPSSALKKKRQSNAISKENSRFILGSKDNSTYIEKLRKKFENSIMQVNAEHDNSDIFKKFHVDINQKPQQDERRARQMIINRLQDFQNKRKAVDDSFFMIVEKLPIERVDDMDGKCARLQRCLCITRINVNSLAATIIKSKIFEAISLMVIVANSVTLAIEDPTETSSEPYQDTLDTIFLILYSIEMVLKILGMGFVFNKNAYLRDAWNIMDFIIVMTGYLQLMLQGASFNLSGLRAFRVLRPLKSISSIEGLKVIVLALLSSLPLLRDTVIVLLFFFFIFAIAGLQLFSGYLKKRCVNIETGVPHPDDDFCGFVDCDPGYFCGKRNENPDFGQTNFDTIFYSLIAIFTSVTLEGWTATMYAINKSFTNLSFIFFIPLVFIGAFFLMNLTLAVIKSKFTKQHEQKKNNKIQGLNKKNAKIEDYVGLEDLSEEQQKKKVEEELVLRNQVLKKWRMILFIKEKIRARIKMFKEKRENETQIKYKTTNASTRLENGQTKIIDYGLIFGTIDQNNEIDSQTNHSARIEIDGQSSQRQLLQTQTRNQQQIYLSQLSSDERNLNPKNKINIQNLKQLDQEAIAEDEDEYKTEPSNVISSFKHFNIGGPSKRLSSKNARNNSNGSKSTPKSTNQDNIERRRSSSKLNFQSQIQFLQDNKNSTSKDIFISSPVKKMKILGMQGFNKQKKVNPKESNSNSKASQKALQINKLQLNEEFFLEFIKNDFQILEQVFSEQQLLDIAEQADDPENYENDGAGLFEVEDQIEEDDLHQFSEVSIITDDYQNRQLQINPQIRSQSEENGNDDRNQTPYTSTTNGMQVQYVKGPGNHIYRQRSKNTQNNFLSQDLSISDIYETNAGNEQVNGPNYDNANESPQTFQSISNDIINSNEMPLNRQITDFTSQDHKSKLVRDNKDQKITKMGPSNKANIQSQIVAGQQNLSSSNLTAYNQNGTVHSDAIGLIPLSGHKSKTMPDPYDKKRKMGSSKIIPYEINSFDAVTAEKIMRIRHGPGTIQNQDEIRVENSVLNSRYLISHHLEKHQKVYLRKEKFDFQKSSDDILEMRNKKIKESNRQQKKLEATAYNKNWKIKPYQRKMKLTGKIYKADEDQVEYLHHLGLEPHELIVLIQQQYDEPYITNTYVTGTLSIAIHDKKDVVSNRTRKIQSLHLQQRGYDEPSEEEVFNQSMSINYQRMGTNNSIQPLSPMRRTKTQMKSQKNHMRILSPKEQLQHDLKTSIFMKATANPILSKSTKRFQTNSSGFSELKKRMTMTGNRVIDSSARRALLLRRQAAKDPKLQKKLILSALNKDAYRSNIFRMTLITRKNRITREEIDRNPHIEGMLDIYEGEEEEEEESDEEEEESDDDDDIKDDFLDRAIDCKTEILKAKKKAMSTNKNEIQWSGQDVLTDFDPISAALAIKKISIVRVWPKFIYGWWKKFQVPLKEFVQGTFFDNFMTLAVTVNTVALALDRYGIDQTDADNLSTMNTVFTWIFICEMSFKIIGLGPIKYFKDKMNYLDCIVVLLSIVEMSFLSNSGTNLSAFRSIRIFRTFRVLRVARLLKSMQSMQVIMSVLVRSMDSFIYLALLLLLFIFIFSLLGMQVFGGNYNFDENFSGPSGVPRTNYNSFNSAFLTTFQIVTLEGWPQLYYDALRSPVQSFISTLYFISWVFLGNFMLLNLFLAILLDSFTAEAPHKKSDEEESEKDIKRKHLEELDQKEGQELIEYYQEVRSSDGNDNKKKAVGLGGKKKKKKKKKDENMLDESFEYDRGDLLAKKTVIKNKKIDFEGVECELSLYFLSKKNPARIFLFRAVTHTAFETVILILIILSSIKLIYDTYIFDVPDDELIQIASKNIDLIFTIVFALESFLKTLAFGFIQDKGSYLRETWSQMDFFIVVTSIIDASFENINVPIIKILRLLRTLRPLRFISHNGGMKTIVVALLGSVGGIINVLIVVMVVWMMFAILAVNFFGGKLQYCTIDTYKMQTKKECLQNRGEWKTYDYNFDSVPQAMITLFALATLEDWPDIMYNCINIGGLELGPVVNSTPQNGYFFVIYILIGSYLFLNLFVGVIFKEFEDAQEEEKAAMMLKEHQIKWVDMMKMIVNANPDLETTNRPKSKWRAAVHAFMTGEGRKVNYVDIFVMACIVLNMFQMAVNFEGSSAKYNNILDYINYFFTAVFALECILKLIAFGWSYFRNSWNIFDFCVVVASGLDIAMNQLNSTSLKFLRVGPQLARVMRVLRVSRLFRLINKYKGLQALIQTIQFSLPSLLNVFALLMLVIFIFSVLATFLFRNITEGEIISDDVNFKNFSNSLMALIRMLTGEDWIYMMYDCMRTPDDGCIEGRNCGLSYAPVFFIPYMMISTFIMLNLFILVIIQQFELYYLQEDNVLEKFKDNLELFKKTWTKFTRDQNCLRLKDTKLVAFFRAMDPPLGMSDKSDKDIIKSVVLMELVSDEEGFVYFNELLFRAMRMVYGEMRVKNKILVEHELKAMKKIEEIKQKMKKKQWKLERTDAVQVNPFMLQMYMNISFKAWVKKYRENADKREIEKQCQSNIDTQKFDIISEESAKQQVNNLKEQSEEWEYKTENDVECSSNEDSFYEEDEDNSDDDDPDNINNQESSRMLKHQKQVDSISIQALRTRKITTTQNDLPLDLKEAQSPLLNKSKIDDIFNNQRISDLHGQNPTKHQLNLISQVSHGNDSSQQATKRLSSRSNMGAQLQIEIPKKRISNSQQPPVVRVDKDKDQINLESKNQEFQFELNLQSIQPNQSMNQNQKQSSQRVNVNNSNRKKDNVMISSRSGGSLEGDELQQHRDSQSNNYKSQQREQEDGDQIVLLKINMDSQYQSNTPLKK